MRTWNEIGIWGLVVGASLGLHTVVFGGFGRLGGDDRAPARPSTLVEMSVAPPKAPVPSANAAEKPAPLPARRVALARAPRAAARRLQPSTPPPPPAAAAPPPEAEALADFTGVTLTNTGAGAAGWSSATGNGQATRGAIGRPGARATGRNVDGDPDSTGHGPPVVGEADLSRRPTAPDLTLALARAYPEEARRRALAGKAMVRALVLPDGHLTRISTQFESAPGFGAACARTLRDSLWSPPLDRNARAVSTFIGYTCRFEVQ